MVQIPRINTITRVWKRIDEIEGMKEYRGYEVSNHGEVRSLYYRGYFETKLLTPYVNTDGYLCVSLCSNGKRKIFKIHRLVAKAFIPNPDNLPCVNHIDEDKTNNNVNNLEWCDHEYNINYGTRNKRASKARTGKGTKKIICIELNKVFNSVTEAAEELNVYQQNISKVLTGNSKTAKGYHFEYYEE